MAYLSWKFKGDIRAENGSTTAVTFGKITIPWLPGMDPTFKDIRFSGKGGQPLKYWIQTSTAHTKTTTGSAVIWVQVPVNTNKIFYHYGNGAAASESSLAGLGTLFYDDLETGAVDSAKWSTKSSMYGGTAGIRTDYKTGAYSIGTNQAAMQGEGVSNYDQCDALLKIPLTSIAVGTTVNIAMSVRHWKTTTYGAVFGGLGFGGTTEIYGISNTGVWKEVLSVITRTATSSWSITIYVDGSLLGTVTKTKTFSTYFLYGLQTRLEMGSGYSCYLRADNVLAWAGTAPTLTLLSHYPAPDPQAAALSMEGARAALTLSPGYSMKDAPISAAAALTLSPTAPELRAITGGVGNLTLSPTFEIHDIKISIEAALNLSPIAAPLKYYLEEAGETLTLAPTFPPTKDILSYSPELILYPVCTETKSETLADYPVGEATVSKTITDACWQLETEFVGPEAPPVFFPLHHDAQDHTGVTRHLFTGIAPSMNKDVSSAGMKTRATAYDYSWYLSAQYIPDDARTMEVSTAWWVWGRSSWQDWIEYLLEDTGITAYRIRTGPAVVWKQFIFTNKTTKKEAIDQISKYCNYVFEVRWRDYGTTENPDWRPVAYWVPEAEIDDSDDGLDIPAPVTLTWPEPHLVDMPKIETNPEERINRVRIIGANGEGAFYSRTVETAAVTAGAELPREYMEESSSLTTQTQVNTYASAMLTYFARPAVTVSMKFIDRFDLQLYQKIKFGAGFPLEFYELTDGRDGINYLRIVSIKYHTGPADNYVEVTAVYDHPIIIIKNRQHIVKPCWITEVEDSVKKGIESQIRATVGTIESIAGDGLTAVMITELGSRIRIRLT